VLICYKKYFYTNTINSRFSCQQTASELPYYIRDITVIPSTYQANFQIDQTQCLAQNQCALSTFFHSHQSHSPKSTKKTGSNNNISFISNIQRCSNYLTPSDSCMLFLVNKKVNQVVNKWSKHAAHLQMTYYANLRPYAFTKQVWAVSNWPVWHMYRAAEIAWWSPVMNYKGGVSEHRGIVNLVDQRWSSLSSRSERPPLSSEDDNTFWWST